MNRDTHLHYFCSLLIADIESRIEQDACAAKEVILAIGIVNDLKHQQAQCYLTEANEESIAFDHKTLYQAMKPLLKSIVVGLLMLFSQRISAQGVYSTRKANLDTFPVYLTLSCYPDSLVQAIRVRHKISDTATGFRLVYPGKKNLPKDCRITAISSFPKRVN